MKKCVITLLLFVACISIISCSTTPNLETEKNVVLNKQPSCIRYLAYVFDDLTYKTKIAVIPVDVKTDHPDPLYNVGEGIRVQGICDVNLNYIKDKNENFCDMILMNNFEIKHLQVCN